MKRIIFIVVVAMITISLIVPASSAFAGRRNNVTVGKVAIAIGAITVLSGINAFSRGVAYRQAADFRDTERESIDRSIARRTRIGMVYEGRGLDGRPVVDPRTQAWFERGTGWSR